MVQTLTHLIVRQASRATFRALVSEHSLVVQVRSGVKRISRASGSLHVGPGQLAVIPTGEPLTVENMLPTGGGTYQASALVVELDAVPPGDPCRVATDDRALAAFDRAEAACEDPLLPAPLRAHAVAEVLLWLAAEGVGGGMLSLPAFSGRLRTVLSQDLAMRWTAAEAARALAVSEATLRRRLTHEGTGFSDVLADLRMTRALGLLQSTSHPVGRVAIEVGYDCASRFAVRFRKRFGIVPSAVRFGFDRTGTAFDRLRITEGNATRY